MKQIKNITDFISESITNNSSINDAADKWVQTYNRQKGIDGSLKVINGVIQFGNPYQNSLVIADPDLLVDGHLPKLKFDYSKLNDDLILDIRCDEFSDFSNIPASDHTTVVIDGRVARPKIKDFKQIDNCDYLSIELYGKTNINTLAGIEPFINKLQLIDVPNTPELLSSAKDLVFRPVEMDKYGLITNFDFAYDAAGSKPLIDFFKNNRFSGAFKINLFDAYINDFSWMKYMPNRIAALYLKCPSIDPYDEIYDDFRDVCNKIVINNKKIFMNFDGIGNTHFSAADIQKFIKSMETLIAFSKLKIVTSYN